LLWGEKDVTARWFVDEMWVIVDEIPTDTENRLIVTFNDDNGAIPLGSFESDFRTGSNSSETLRITADQFNTEQFDSDGNGISNIDEQIAGSESPASTPSTPVSTPPSMGPLPFQARIDLMPGKTFRFS